jgi:L-threonylcarbamoyladenylate synthase
MLLLDSSEENLRTAGRALAEGKLVAIPTETVYGLGADAFNPSAVARVFEAKARPSFDPLIVHIARIADLTRIASSVPLAAALLAERLWPGPLTMVLPKRTELPDIVTSGLDSVAVRFPSHPVARKIIEYSGTVVAAPSANPFGYISPTTARHVADMLGERVDYIIDGGACEVGVESTVLDMTGVVPVILRHGGMPVERIREIVGEVLEKTQVSTRQDSEAMVSPGLLDSHYAPHSPLTLFASGEIGRPEFAKAPHASRIAAIVFDKMEAHNLIRSGGFEEVYALTENRDMRKAASRLFAILHELDGLGFDAIYAEKVPDEGLGKAINDRLYRASKKR